MMNVITKLSPRAYMQRVRRNRDIYCYVKALKCTSACLSELSLIIHLCFFISLFVRFNSVINSKLMKQEVF